jgi:hypothetical protein
LAANITEDLNKLYEKNNAKQDEIQHTKTQLGEVLKKNWKNKAMHDKYIRNIDISEEDTFLCLMKGDLKAETESEIAAAQDQVLQMTYYATKVLNTETDSICRLCHQFDEKIDYIISACPILAKKQYIKRHDRVSAQLHSNICKETGTIRQKKHWYEHVPKSVETSRGGKVTILWNQQVQTDKTILNNKPDIVICDNEKGTCMLIDIAIPGDRNVIQKDTEKILKIRTLQY